MDSFQDISRQLRIALIAITIILPTGVIGYMLIEDMSLLDAVWITIITLATIGYGDIVARTDLGRMFTIVLIIFGLGTFAFAAQAAFSFFASPAMRDIRVRRHIERKVATLRNHYIICGEGRLVDNVISYLLAQAELRRELEAEQLSSPLQNQLQRFLGSSNRGIRAFIRYILKHAIRFMIWFVRRGDTLLDLIVVITKNREYAGNLRNRGLLVIENDPSDELALRHAGLIHAQAMMVMLENDTETLLTVLTARTRNSNVFITAATLDENMSRKMVRVGANNVIAPYEVAGQFLNNATLRPAVNDFFSNILFDHKSSVQVVQLYLYEDSPWIGRQLGDLNLRERFEAGVIGLGREDGDYLYAPTENYILQPNEVLLAITPLRFISSIQRDSQPHTSASSTLPNWQRLPIPPQPPQRDQHYTYEEAEAAVKEMSAHFIICGSGRVMLNATSKLDPARPFVIVSNDRQLSDKLLRDGFRTIYGDPTQDQILYKAGIERALAIMVSIEDEAASVLTVLNCRTMSKRLLITATATVDDMIPKLRRAGADRVVSPFRIAAQFVLLATTRPAVSDFMQHVLYNYQTGLETTELYMQDNSPWIGKTIGELHLGRIFRAGVLGIRLANGRFRFAPPDSHVIGEHEVLIITTPMANSDELRQIAHGGETKRPKTLRREDAARTTAWS